MLHYVLKAGAALILHVGLIGCMGTAPEGRGRQMLSDRGGPSASAHAFILDRSLLGDAGESLLSVMIDHVPGLRVERATACPSVALRGHTHSMAGVSEPRIYVDGAQAVDTCVLESVRAADVDWVEVYPTGVTSRPGFHGNAHGLVLIFMRDR